MKIKEIVIVEGKNDSNVLKSYFDCDTIETHGTRLNRQTMQTIKKANETRGVIIFTDPDAPGEKIRSMINQHVPNCKNAFIAKDKAKTTKKVGVEHASKEDLQEALSHLMTYSKELHDTITWDEFLSLGLSGKEASAEKRKKLGEKLFLGKANAKTCFKRLNMIQMTIEDCRKCLEEFE